MYAFQKYGVSGMLIQDVRDWKRFLQTNRSGFKPAFWEEFYQALEQREAQLDLKAMRVQTLFLSLVNEELRPVHVGDWVIINTGAGRSRVEVMGLYERNGRSYLNGRTFSGQWYPQVPLMAIYKS